MKRWFCKYKDLPGVWVTAPTTKKAGKIAAERYGELGCEVDDLCIDVREASEITSETDVEVEAPSGVVPRSVLADDSTLPNPVTWYGTFITHIVPFSSKGVCSDPSVDLCYK